MSQLLWHQINNSPIHGEKLIHDRQITNLDGKENEPPYLAANIGDIFSKPEKQEQKEQLLLNTDGSESAYVPKTLESAIKERQATPANEAKPKPQQNQKEEPYRPPTLADKFPKRR